MLLMEAITKRYPGVIANREITLEVQAGEVHALLGENGAGKSTLMNILYGMTAPDQGRIFWQGLETRINSTRQAIRLGIGMVHQHFMLVPPFTALENIVLHTPSTLRQPWLRLDSARPRIERLCAEYGLEVALDSPIEAMSLGMQQRVEIVKALYRGARLLILDEPTAVLTPPEVERLFGVLRRLVTSGRAVLLISHKLDEVMAISQRVSVLRDGRLIATLNTAETSPDALARLMVGRTVMLPALHPDAPTPQHRDDQPALRIENLSVPPVQGHDTLRDVSLNVYPGEILGIAGVDGNGQRALLETLCGIRKPASGAIHLLGHETTHLAPRQIAALNIGRIPDDRQTMGLLLDMPIRDNLILQNYDRAPLAWRGWRRPAQIGAFARELVSRFDIRVPGLATPVRKLSGGNQQKVILAREMHHDPRVLIVANPTRGLDIGATEYVYQQLLRQREQGAAILLISSDLEEVLALSDRVAVMYEGAIVGTLPAAEASRDQVGLMMGGTILQPIVNPLANTGNAVDAA